ncbi:MAG: asparagine--tRNA ligase [Phycisphaerales bacterium]|nr:asparagine--tRNA ligase [Phycisphaerales bacterium]
MSTTVTISKLNEHVGETVTLAGWLYNSRIGSKVAFLIVRDGTGLCQGVVTKEEVEPEVFADAVHLTQESSVRVTGLVHADERAVGGYELHVTGLEPVHSAVEYPITLKAHGHDFLFKHRHLWLRSRRPTAIMKIRHTVIDAVRRFFNDNGFVLVDTPIFAPSAGEGAQTLFSVDYFGEPMYLAQTGQLYLESAAMAYGKVYCFGPTFRAEKSKTRRHLTEFWMVEPEIAYADLDDVMAVAEDFVYTIAQRVLAEHRADLEFLGQDVAVLERIRKPFYRLTYSQAVDILHGPQARELLEKDLAEKNARIEELKQSIPAKEQERDRPGVKKYRQEQLAAEVITEREELADLQEQVKNIPTHMELAAGFEWGKDLGGSDETIISRLHDRPVFVTHYPRGCKAFYMKQDPHDSRLVKNFDLLAPDGYGEIIGGSQREDDLDVLLERMAEEGLATEPYEWYLDLRRYGSVPHGGFGLGIERTVAWLCGLRHIRETIAYPRLMGKVYP